ncbi:MAG: dipeptide ABC transporter permease DppC, partial [Burkholderiaceae bacterium]
MNARTLSPSDAPTAAEPPRPLHEFWSYFSANKGAIAGLVVVVMMLLIALFAPWLAPHDPLITNSGIALQPPFWQAGGTLTYPLGTDAIGRDILSRLIFGARLSLV